MLVLDNSLPVNKIQEVYNGGKTRSFKDYGNGLAHYWPFEGNLEDYVGGRHAAQSGVHHFEYVSEKAIDIPGADATTLSLESPYAFAHDASWSAGIWFYVEDVTALSARLDYNMITNGGVPRDL